LSILIIGIATQQEIRQRTIAIACGNLTPKETDPKVWFTSVESLAQVLSEDNRAMIAAIRDHHPNSISALAEIVGRAQSNLTRTLKKMATYGIIELRKEGRKTIPFVIYDEIELHVPLAA